MLGISLLDQEINPPQVEKSDNLLAGPYPKILINLGA